MQEKIISEINSILAKEKQTKKGIYENLLSRGIVKPKSEKLVYEIIEYGLQNGFIKTSKILKFRKKRGKLPQPFTTDQLIKIFDTNERPKLAVVMWLGFFCGLRIREVCNLKISDINLKDETIFIRNSKNTNRSRDGYGKDRVVTIPKVAIGPLKIWMEIINGGDWLIPSMLHPDKPIRTKTIHEQFRELLRNAGLSEKEYEVTFTQKNHGKKKEMKKTVHKYRFHTLRHSFASYLLDKGVPIENIQRCLGHEQLDTTMIYAKVKDRKTQDFVNSAFDKPLRLTKKQGSEVFVNEKQVVSERKNLAPEEILKMRLARGEIDPLSYERLMAVLNPDKSIHVVHSVRKEE